VEAIIHAKRWKGSEAPRKILVIRFQALGDTVITLPYLQSLKKQFPQCELHLLTRVEVSHIPKHLQLFERVFVLHGGRQAKVQFALALLKVPGLWSQNYDAIIDLQNNRISRIVRKILNPESWSEFDLFSPVSAGERTRRTIESIWTWEALPEFSFVRKQHTSRAIQILEENGFRDGNELVILNPAGYCTSRNWPLKRYVEFAQKWCENINPSTQFVLLLLPTHYQKARFLKEGIGDACIDLTGKADQVHAFDIVAEASLVLTEDSGLMHMAWTQRIPTVALFSSSRKDWSGPQGNWSVCLDSSDLDCGPCALEVCKYGDNRCLTRYSADFVLEQANHLRLNRQYA